MSESLKYMRIETKRFIIRKMKESDAEALFAIFSDAETMRFIEPVFTYEKTMGIGRKEDKQGDWTNNIS